jgi:hypothetical protein
MEFKNTLESAIHEMDEIRGILSDFMQKKNILQIEIDLAMSKIRNLYDLLLVLNKSGFAADSKVAFQESIDKKQKTTGKSNQSNLLKTMEILIPSDKHISEDSDQDILSIDESIKGPATVTHKPDFSKKQSEIPPVIEQHKQVYDSISEGSQKKQKDISSLLQSKPIRSIEEAIGVNDKFLFIRELFAGNTMRYKETIDILNTATDFNSAYQYIENNFEWDMENEAVQKLLELVRRRHISG